MLTIPLALALSAGLLVAAPAPSAPRFPVDRSGSTRDFEKPPAGTPADQALWQAAYDVDNALVVEQHTAAALARQAKTNVDRLGDPAARGGLAEERAQALAKPLVARWTANVELIASTWPVSKVRVCRYELLNFESAMIATDAPAQDPRLADARRELSACVEKATSVLRSVRASNDDLRAASAAAEAALGPAKTTAASQVDPPPKR